MPLTKRQRRILDAIVFLLRKGEFPTVREVGAIVGLSSPATVYKHLQALEAEKLITISGKSRGIRIADPEILAALLEDELVEETPPKEGAGTVDAAASGDGPKAIPNEAAPDEATEKQAAIHRRVAIGRFLSRQNAGVPVMGAIAAGRPIESRSEAFTSPDSSNSYPSLAIDPRMFVSSGDLIALQVEGQSMAEAGILEGDYVILRRQETVEPGEIAAVLVDGEVTLKRWYHDRPAQRIQETCDSDNEYESAQETVRLEPANECFSPIEITEGDGKEVMVLGKYVGLVRGELRVL